ncbi:MAG: class I fructose-bisphosphate aldolase [Anaerolineales bacterium]
MIPTRRLNRIFRPDGRALIVAMDHGMMDGPRKGLENPGETLLKIAEGGADAVLTTYGVARRFARELAPLGLIMRIDGGSTSLGTMDGPGALFYTVEDALRLGADAIAVSGFPGSDKEEASLENIAAMAGEAHAWGLVLLAEMVPGGFDSGPEFRTLESIALSARVGVELGADIIKTPYVEGFVGVTNTCYSPVVILGGAKRGNEREMLEEIKVAVGAGASGVAIGRNIFGAEDPAAMTAAIAAILHEDASVDEALAIMERR